MKGQIKTALDLFKKDSANILAAWDWAVQNEKIQLVDQAIYGMGDYFENTGREDLGLGHIQAVLDMLLAADDEVRETILAQHLQAKTLLLLGWFHIYYRHDQASMLFDQASEIIDQLFENGVDARIDKSRLLLFQGALHQMEDENTAASDLIIEAVELSKEIDLFEVTWRGLTWLGDLYMNTGSPSKAKQLYAECQVLAEARKNSRASLVATFHLGMVSRQLLAYDDAQAYFDKAIELARKHQDRRELTWVLGARIGFELFLGQFQRAIETSSQAMAIVEDEIGARDIYLDVIAMNSLACLLSGEFKQAESLLVKARRLIFYDIYTQLSSIIPYAEYQAMTGKYSQALQKINSLDDLIQDTFIGPFHDGRRNMVLGWLALADEAFVDAHRYFDLSIQHHKKMSFVVEWVAWSQAGIAAALMFQHQWEEAYQVLGQSLQASIEIKGIIPLMFVLPFACYYLAQEHPDQARDVYAQIQTSPFLAKAQFFKDTVYRRLPDEIKQSQRKVDEFLPETELIQNLWVTASKIVALWESE
jgi:tetratricopeptide (TPR) repeat protein